MVKPVDIQDNLSKAPLVAREQHVLQTTPETVQRQLAQVSAQEQILDHSRVRPTEQEEPAEMRVYDRGKNARQQGLFDGQIVPVTIPQRKGESIAFAADEHPRDNVTPESLAGLRPAFRSDGTVAVPVDAQSAAP